MKKTLILFLALLSCALMWAQNGAQTHEGYLITSRLQSHSRQSLKSRVKTTLYPGRVALNIEGDGYWFTMPDASEGFILTGSKFYKYYPVAQDAVDSEYVAVDEFKRGTRKVKVSTANPAKLQVGKKYTFRTSYREASCKEISVRLVRLAASNVTLVTEVDDEFHPEKRVNISGQTLVEITFHAPDVSPSYMLYGQQVALESNLAGTTYDELVVDDKGFTFAKGENGKTKADNALSYVFGEIPSIAIVGWISDSQILVDDIVYELITK